MWGLLGLNGPTSPAALGKAFDDVGYYSVLLQGRLKLHLAEEAPAPNTCL
jgi:hypothetical protein